MKDGWLQKTHIYNSMFEIDQALSKQESKSLFYSQSLSCDKFQFKKKTIDHINIFQGWVKSAKW